MNEHEHNDAAAPQEEARCCGGKPKSEPCAERGQHHPHHGGGCGGHGHKHGEHGHGGCCGRHGAQQE